MDGYAETEIYLWKDIQKETFFLEKKKVFLFNFQEAVYCAIAWLNLSLQHFLLLFVLNIIKIYGKR